MAHHMAPTYLLATEAIQILKPLVGKHQHVMSLKHQAGFAGRHAPLLQLFGRQQVQKVFLTVAQQGNIGMGWTGQKAPTAGRTPCAVELGQNIGRASSKRG